MACRGCAATAGGGGGPSRTWGVREGLGGGRRTSVDVMTMLSPWSMLRGVSEATRNDPPPLTPRPRQALPPRSATAHPRDA
jgi:hypothetical protein